MKPHKKKSTLKHIIKIFPNVHLLLLGGFFTLFSAVASVAFSYILKEMIDAAVGKNQEDLLLMIRLVSILIFWVLCLAYFKTKVLGKYTEKGLEELRNVYAHHLNFGTYQQLQSSHSGDFLSIGTNDMNKIRQFTLTTLSQLISIPITAILALALLFVLNWKLTLISFALIPILIIISSILSVPIGKSSKKLQTKLGALNTQATDFISGIEVAKTYQITQLLEDQNQDSILETIDLGKKLERKRAILESISLGISIIPFAITFLLGGYYVGIDELSIGGLLAFINLLNFVTFPLGQLGVLIGETKRDLASAQRIFDIIDEPLERTDGVARTIKEEEMTCITFEDVSFTYDEKEEPIINKFNLSIKKGDTVAFVGPSGGGKSTIGKLLQGYYDTYDGKIHIFGHELKTWHLKALRSNMSIVTQDTMLFPETVLENIKYGRYDATYDEIIEASHKAYAHMFISNMNLGYETHLSELGSSLSGGQKQRIAIARAILKDAPILILDEATSALDTESESIITQALETFQKEKTAIVIAHRLSTIIHADCIYVIKDGSVKAHGTHQELLKTSIDYQKLYQEQLSEKDVEQS